MRELVLRGLVLLCLGAASGCHSKSVLTPDPDSFAPTACGHAAVYDPVGDRMLVFDSDRLLAFDFSSRNWEQLTPDGNGPGPRSGVSVVYDPGGERVLLFGGRDTTVALRGDTWALNLGTELIWEPLASTGPAPRESPAAVFDTKRNRMILFGGLIGGYTGSSPVRANDAWYLDLQGSPTWVEMHPSGDLPSTRSHAAAAYDAFDDALVIVGGWANEPTWISPLGDTWSLSLADTAWTLLGDAGIGKEWDASAVYDPSLRRMVLFGGNHIECSKTCSIVSSDATYILDFDPISEWRQAATATSPPVRFQTSAILNTESDSMILFGGCANNGVLGDVWAFSIRDETWSQLR